MEGKVILMTGGARGLGKAFAQRLLEEGAKVCIADILEDLGLETERAFQAKYGRSNVIFCKCDVTSRDQFEDVFKRTLAVFGRLDVVCNNAGISDEANWEEMLDINLKAVMQGTFLAVEYMSPPKGKGGMVINISSAAGVLPMAQGPVYAASKHGVVGFTRSLAPFSKKNHKVRLNCLCPTFTATEMMTDTKSMIGQRSPPADVTKAMKLISDTGVLSAADVVDGFMKLLANDMASGAVMLVSPMATTIIKLPKRLEQILEVSSKL